MEHGKIYLYPKWLRAWHGINALAIILLILSGISMQYSGKSFSFIRFDIAVSMHNLMGIMVSLSYLCFVVGNIITANGKQYKIVKEGLFVRLKRQTQYYLWGYFKGEAKPYPISKENKFNPLQRISYVIAMYILVPLVIISGIGLLYPGIIIERFFSIGGVQLTAIFHAILGFLISLFLIIHLYVASVGKHPLKNYKSIINGYHTD